MGEFARHFLADTATTLALLAIVFAVVQFTDSRKLKHAMMEALEKMNTVLKSVSSRFIGTFPSNIREITEVVRRADRRLLILTDWVGYGSYSVPGEYQIYERHLQDIRMKQIPVCMLVYDRACLRLQLQEQIPEAQFPAEKIGKRFKDYFTIHTGRPSPTTYEEFMEEMLVHEQERRDRLKDYGVQVQELSERSLVVLWTADRKDAAFCFQTHGGNERGQTFRTQDTGLIDSIQDIFAARWKGSLPSLGNTKSDSAVA